MVFRKIGMYREFRKNSSDKEYATIIIPGRGIIKAEKIVCYADGYEEQNHDNATTLVYGSFSAKDLFLAMKIIDSSIQDAIKNIVENSPEDALELLIEFLAGGFEEAIDLE